MASRLVRASAVTVNDVLDGHKLLEIDCVDRVYLTLSVPSLVVGGQVVNFLTDHEHNPIPSPALLERRGQAFRRAVLSFAEANDIPVVNFAGRRDKGRPGVLADSPWPERKIDQVMPLMRKAAATGRSQVVAIGVAQEYQRVFTGVNDKTATGAVWFSCNRAERRVTCYYFYLWDAGFGPAFIKICAYFPYRARSGSTGTSGPSARRPGWACPSGSCPTGSPPARTRPCCRRSVTGSARAIFRSSPNGGERGCRCRSPGPTATPATGGTSPCARSRSPRPSPSPPPATPGRSSRPSPPTTSTSAAPTRPVTSTAGCCRLCVPARAASLRAQPSSGSHSPPSPRMAGGPRPCGSATPGSWPWPATCPSLCSVPAASPTRACAP